MKPIIISPAPHIHSGDSVEKKMYNVLIALIPAYLSALYFFGLGALIVSFVSVASCVLFEYLIQKFILKVKPTIYDGSAILTGLLLAFNLPSNLPWWMVVIGAFVAIGLGKMCFGGIGNNPLNPALVGRVFLLISFPAAMTTWPKPLPFSMNYIDAETAATPLSIIKYKLEGMPSQMDLLIGQIGGSLGEISAIALLIGGIYLLASRTITWHIPVSIISTILVFTGIMHAVDPATYANPLTQILCGGILLGAIFMATDYVTSPMSHSGQIIYGIGIGIITVVIRLFGAYPEGMSFAILIMNAVTPLLNNYIKPKRFGGRQK
ncbi:MAG: Electron transport complex protein RnfD [Bacteroidetes bacterium ADurb.Bin302]|nr:MAG: Electron transport complex protein RnfD [Bacteroidetes bacterium ADurb.Bin302]